MNRKRKRMQRKALFMKQPVALVLATCLLAGACERSEDSTEEASADLDLTNVEPGLPGEEPQKLDYLAPDQGDASADMSIVAGEPTDRLSSPVHELIVATATVAPASGSSVSGTLEFRQENNMVAIKGRLEGLEPGLHGLHIHTAGDCSAADATSAREHFSPDDNPHGSAKSLPPYHHIGDLGNVVANSDGVATFEMTDSEMTLGTGENTIISRAVIVHAGADDLRSQPSGDAGARVGCGVVVRDLDAAF